jgi:hypothetical protein
VSDNEDLMIARIARELKKPERIDPSFDARVMAEIRADRAPRLTPWQWLVRKRAIRISPLGGLGFAGALAASMMLIASLDGDGSRSGTGTGSTTVVTETAPVVPVAVQPPVQTVQFVLTAPRAKSVTLVGDFNDWDTASNPMAKSKGGMWTITIPLTAGRYTYTFIVDGKVWVADPLAPRAPADELGQPSSVVTVGGSAS